MNDIWYSENGANWSQATGEAPFSARNLHMALVFNDKMWVIGGQTSQTGENDVWYSNDGMNWIQATSAASFSKRVQNTVTMFDNKLWVIGGYSSHGDSSILEVNDDIWYSKDGVLWKESNTSVSFLKDIDIIPWFLMKDFGL
nr:hypothetical protein [Maribacter sp. Hal144]